MILFCYNFGIVVSQVKIMHNDSYNYITVDIDHSSSGLWMCELECEKLNEWDGITGDKIVKHFFNNSMSVMIF